MKNEPSENNIIFYDGECGLCNRVVTWILRQDTKAVFKFCSLQSQTAHKILKAHHITIKYDTLYYLEDDLVLSKSEAWAVIMKKLYPAYANLIESLRV